MKYRAARRFWERTSEPGKGLPWSNPLGIAVTYMVVRQLAMSYFYFYLGGRGWGELWSSKVFLGLSLPGWFHVTNAAMIVFVITSFWRFLAMRGPKSRILILAYIFALIILSGMQYAVLPARSSGQIWWYVPEGDFRVTMRCAPLFADAAAEDESPPMTLVMRADGNGNVASMRLDKEKFVPGDWEALRMHVIRMLREDRDLDGNQATPEVELDCDYNLRYLHVIDAISTVSGYPGEDDEIVPLIKTIGFSPPKIAVDGGPAAAGPGWPLRLPESEIVFPPKAPYSEPITLVLLKSNHVSMQGDFFLIDEMPSRLSRERGILRTMGKTVRDATIVIRADKDCVIGKVQELIRICQDEGFTDFVLRVRVRQKP